VSVGDAVLVTGCGPIGMFAMDVARAHGATTVAAADVVPEKLDRARERSADVAIDSRERDPAAAVRDAVDELGVDVVVETAGAESAVRSAVDAVRPGGTVVQVGFPHGDVSLPLLDVVEKDADVRGSFRYRNTYPTALDLVAGGDVDAAGLVDFEVPFAEVQDAFQRVVDDPTAVKGVVRVDE
jgi:L-iditol 2-dehydrogenase